MSKEQGKPMSLPADATEKAKEAPKVKPETTKSRGKAACDKSDMPEKIKMAPDHKGSTRYGGQYKESDHPSTAPSSAKLPTDSSKMELDGHQLKKPKKRTK